MPGNRAADLSPYWRPSLEHACLHYRDSASPLSFESPLARSEFTSRNKEQSKSGNQRFERTMKPLFVSIKEDQRIVHWKKLTIFSVAAMVLTALLVEGLWWLLSNTLSLSALIVGLVLGTLIVVRLVVRAITYQEQELEATAEAT